MALILDSSGSLAAVNTDQRLHQAAKEALERASAPRVISPFVLAELDYMVLTRYGRREELVLLNAVERGTYRLEPFSAFDFAEAGAVIEQYAGFGNLGLADASNVVLARRYDTRDILTLDELHFRTLRGPRDLPLRVLPADS